METRANNNVIESVGKAVEPELLSTEIDSSALLILNISVCFLDKNYVEIYVAPLRGENGKISALHVMKLPLSTIDQPERKIDQAVDIALHFLGARSSWRS